MSDDKKDLIKSERLKQNKVDSYSPFRSCVDSVLLQPLDLYIDDIVDCLAANSYYCWAASYVLPSLHCFKFLIKVNLHFDFDLPVLVHHHLLLVVVAFYFSSHCY